MLNDLVVANQDLSDGSVNFSLEILVDFLIISFEDSLANSLVAFERVSLPQDAAQV